MKAAMPDWYRGWADILLQLRAATVSELAFERGSVLHGYVTALFMADVITSSERQRMVDAGSNAMFHALMNLKTPTHKKGA